MPYIPNDADIQMAEAYDTANAHAALVKRGGCPHNSRSGGTYNPETREFSGQVTCGDCGLVASWHGLDEDRDAQL